jgi:hypothetical protein
LITGSRTLDSSRKIPPALHETPRQDQKLANYQTGQIWGALRKAWKGYRIAKVQNDSVRMKEYATRIKTLQGQLGVPQASFPNLEM